MLGLSKSTEISKQLPKKAIYTKFDMKPAERDRFDHDVSRIVIVNEISPRTTTLTQGADVTACFVLLVSLKTREYEERAIAMLPRLIDQKMLLVLECGGESRLAVYHGKLIQTAWKPSTDCTISLTGIDLDGVWENIIMQVGGITLEEGHSLDEQIETDEKRERLEKEIARLEKAARKEVQPKKKFDIVQRITLLRKEL